jgi:molecular chaperone DnaK (HSP70)
MSIPNILAIDFGTSRIKASAWNHENSKVEILPIGLDERNYIPSIFHVDSTGEITFGDVAMDLMIHDPLGVLENVKLNLNKSIRAANGQKKEATDLLRPVFGEILRQFIARSALYKPNFPVSLIFTMPARWNFEDIFSDAVKGIFQLPLNIFFEKEPIAASFQWLQEEQGDFSGYLVIIDIGGGTVDWACLHVKPEKVEIVSDYPPAGIEGAGLELDKSILELLESKLSQSNEEPDKVQRTISYLSKHKELMLDYVRKIKERNQLTKNTHVKFNINGSEILLDSDEVITSLERAGIKRIVDHSCRYIEKAYNVVQQPITCVLTGAGSQLDLMSQSLELVLSGLGINSDGKFTLVRPKEVKFSAVTGAIYHYLFSNGLHPGTQPKESLKKEANNANWQVKNFFDIHKNYKL